MDEVDEIKHRIDIVDLISSYLTLKKAGSNYKAICPFHQEKTPSFMVSSEKQIFKCFGCGESGDVFSFVMKMENLEFPEAMRILAERTGVQLKRRTFRPEEGRDQKTRLYEINNLAARVFNKILVSHPAGKNALDYLTKRKITLETIKDFMIGYAPSQKVLTNFLAKKGFTSLEIRAAGSPDRFFKRIIFPIRDVMGNTIAFTGRVLDPDQEPKYLNSPDTAIFHKGRILYNLNLARGPIKQEKATIVVEGQMDVVASWQTGVKNIVASSGTALTDDHLQILYRYSPNIIFSFDSDTAGKITAKKAYEMAIAYGFNVKMVLLGAFKDPGEMIAQDPKLWQQAVQEPVPVIDWYFEISFQKIENGKSKIEKQQLTSQEKKEIAREILPIIKIIPDSIEQAHYVNLLAKRLSVNEEVIFLALRRTSLKKPEKKIPSGTKPPLLPEELFLGILLLEPKRIKDVLSQVQESDLKGDSRKIYKNLQMLYNQNVQEKDLVQKLKKSLDYESKNKFDSIILSVEELYTQDKSRMTGDFHEVIAHLKMDKKEALKDYYAKEIQKAEEVKDYGRLKQLMKEFQEAISK